MITLLMPVPLRMKIMNRACRDIKPPVGFFRWSHARDDWCRRIAVSVGDKVQNSRVVYAVVIANKSNFEYNI